jgi:hypothetical protein
MGLEATYFSTGLGATDFLSSEAPVDVDAPDWLL